MADLAVAARMLLSPLRADAQFYAPGHYDVSGSPCDVFFHIETERTCGGPRNGELLVHGIVLYGGQQVTWGAIPEYVQAITDPNPPWTLTQVEAFARAWRVYLAPYSEIHRCLEELDPEKTPYGQARPSMVILDDELRWRHHASKAKRTFLRTVKQLHLPEIAAADYPELQLHGRPIRG